MFPDGSGVFQQDLAQCHTSKVVTKLFKEYHTNVVDWPGISSYLNHIEIRGLSAGLAYATRTVAYNVWYHDEEIAGKC